MCDDFAALGLLGSEDEEVVDVLDVMYHQCGTKFTEICLMETGKVVAVVRDIPENERDGDFVCLSNDYDCPF